MADRQSQQMEYNLTSVSSIALGTEVSGGVSANERTFAGVFLLGHDEGNIGDPDKAGPYHAFFYIDSQTLRNQFGEYVIESAKLVVEGLTIVGPSNYFANGGYFSARAESVDAMPSVPWSQITGKDYPPHGNWKGPVYTIEEASIAAQFDVTQLIRQVISGQRTIFGIALSYVASQSHYPDPDNVTAYLKGDASSRYKLIITGYSRYVGTETWRFDTLVRLAAQQDFNFDVSVCLSATVDEFFDTRINLGSTREWLFDTKANLGAKRSEVFDVIARIGSRRQWSYDVSLLMAGQQSSTFDTLIRLYAVDPSVRKKYGKLPSSVRCLRRYRGPIESERENTLVLESLHDLLRAKGILGDLSERLTSIQDRILHRGGTPGLYDLRLP